MASCQVTHKMAGYTTVCSVSFRISKTTGSEGLIRNSHLGRLSVGRVSRLNQHYFGDREQNMAFTTSHNFRLRKSDSVGVSKRSHSVPRSEHSGKRDSFLQVVRWLSEITVHWRTKAPNFACSFTLTFSTILA